MDHCRGFLRGLSIGCLVGPLMSVPIVAALCAKDDMFGKGDLGWIPDLIFLAVMGVPGGALLGSFVGAIVDLRRFRDVPRLMVVLLLFPFAALLLSAVGYTLLSPA